MTNKLTVIEAVKKMPDDATLEDISEQIAILVAIERGRQDIEAGRVLSHDEVKRRAASWTTKNSK